MGLLSKVRSFLTRSTPVTANYRPFSNGTWIRHVGKRPPLTLWMIDQMEHDPKLRLATSVADAPLLDLEVEVDCENSKVGTFVKEQLEKLWSLGNRKFLRARRYGYAGFEIMFREHAGLLEVDGVRDIHPRDVRPLTRAGVLVGIRIKNIDATLPTPKGLWLVHDQRWGYWFGRSEYENSWPAYWEKWMNDGAIDKRVLRMLKDAWIGDRYEYDPYFTMKTTSGQEIGVRDLVREAAEQRMSGGIMAYPVSVNATTSQKSMEYFPPTPVEGATPIFDYIKMLDVELVEGQNVPDEVLHAAESGGYSGRSIPMLAFLKASDVDMAEFLTQLDQQVIWPMARLNFGLESKPYDVKHRPLVETFTKNLGGGEEGKGEAGEAPQNGHAGNGFSPFRSGGVGATRFGGGPFQLSEDDPESLIPSFGPRLDALLKKKRPT